MNKFSITAVALLLCGAMYAAENTATISLNITEASGSKTDNIILLENEAYSEAFVQGEDAKKMSVSDNTKVFIYTMVGSDTCANKGTNNLYGTEIIVKTNSTSRFTFSVDYQAGSKLYYLYDVDSIKVTPLLTTSTYTCDIPANQTVKERFYLLDLSEHLRDIPAGEWGTICYPEFIVDTVGAKIYEFVHKTVTEVAVDPVSLPLDSGKAYVFQATANAQKFIYADPIHVAKAPHGNKGLMGSFSEIVVTEGAPYVIIGESLVPAMPATVPAFRAYIPCLDSIPDPTGAPARVGRRMFTIKNETTELENVNANANANRKVMINGQLIIIRDDKKFNAQGAQL